MQLERQGFHRLGFYDSRAFIVDKSQKNNYAVPLLYTYDLKSSLTIAAKNRKKTGFYACDLREAPQKNLPSV